MTEEAIYKLTKMYLEEIDKKQEQFIMTRKELISFCIKLVKVLQRVENETISTQ